MRGLDVGLSGWVGRLAGEALATSNIARTAATTIRLMTLIIASNIATQYKVTLSQFGMQLFMWRGGLDTNYVDEWASPVTFARNDSRAQEGGETSPLITADIRWRAEAYVLVTVSARQDCGPPTVVIDAVPGSGG